MSRHMQSASDAVRQMKQGAFSSEELVRDCLAQIEASDAAVRAWCHLDADAALAQAQACDRRRQQGRPLGPLHGVPVGVKDIFDTADMPTAYGSPIHDGRRPERDATVVSKLREAGAVVLGKTVTAEFAFMTPGATANPHNTAHTPGGSSSGSAAAVAAGQVPLSVGSQTNGSVIRPAAFCGVYGLKPSRGMISRAGVLATSQTLDQIGVFARTLEDAALLADALTGFDAADPATYARPKPLLLDGYRSDPPVEPRLARLTLPYDERLSADARAGMGELQDALEAHVETVAQPDGLDELIDAHRLIHEFELARNLQAEFEQSGEAMSPGLHAAVERGRSTDNSGHAAALEIVDRSAAFFAELFQDFDAILTHSAPGAAPAGLDSTGDPVFCTIWTSCGLPCLSLPLLRDTEGMPMGIQLVGGIEEDDRLCRTARWLLAALADE